MNRTDGNGVSSSQCDLPKRLPNLAGSDLLDVVSHLWAAQIWGNKEYLVQKIISVNGLETVNSSLARLFDRAVAGADRYDAFLTGVSHFGPAAVTEMMCYLEPHRCGIWNSQAREALRRLGFDTPVSPTKYKISGTEYVAYNSLLAGIAKELRLAGITDVDLLTVDYFLYEIAQVDDAPGRPPVPEVTAGHDEVRDLIAAIGAMLGF